MATYILDEEGYPIPFPPRPMTEEEFLAFEADEEVRAEWSDGICFQLIPPGFRHQQIAMFLQTVLGLYVELHGLGVVIPMRFEMRLPLPNGQCSYRQPDLMFVSRENGFRITNPRLEGPADLVLEIITDETADQDLRVKPVEYAESGIAEFWIVDLRPDQAILRMLSLSPDATYVEIPPDTYTRLNSKAVSGFWIDAKWLCTENSTDSVGPLLEIVPELFKPNHILHRGTGS